MLNAAKENAVVTKTEILDYYFNNCKQKADFKVGLEYERLSLNAVSKKNAEYKDLKKIIEHFASVNGWGILKDDGLTIGAMKGETTISLEPGGQFEISLGPKATIDEIESEITEITDMLDKIAKICNVKFVPIGNTPFSTYQNINIVPKNRYLIMADYLPNQGAFASVMMRETAGVQVNFDYESESDALEKLRVCAKISPFLTGFFANSPMRLGKMLPFKSFRALAWKYTDNNRTGIFYKNLLKNRSCFGFEDYVDEILKVPMLFFQRGNEKIEVKGKINFKEFMKNGFKGYAPNFADYILHSSLTFPDVRLKNCIEIRNHDSQKLPLALAICAFYKGILHNEDAISEIGEMLKNLDGEACSELGFLAAKNGLDFILKDNLTTLSPKEITKKLFEISYNNLKNMDEGEQKYLEEPILMLENGKYVIETFDVEEFFQ